MTPTYAAEKIEGTWYIFECHDWPATKQRHVTIIGTVHTDNPDIYALLVNWYALPERKPHIDC